MKKFNLIVFPIFLLIFIFSASPVFSHEKEKGSRENGDNVVCTQDAKKCPDGSFVGRKGSDCEFKECSDDKGEEVKNREHVGEIEKNKQNEQEDFDDEGDLGKEDNCKGNIIDDECESGDIDDNDIEDDESDLGKRSEERMSKVADAVQEMVRLSEKTQKIGEQIREIAQEQKNNYEKVEKNIEEVSKRGGFIRFFIGPDYSKIKEMEKYTEKYNEKLQEMGQVVEQITAQDVVNAIDLQIQEMEQVKADLEADIKAQKGGFSLFGWLNRLLNK